MKMRASLVSMLLLFFTMVLFYQNCSQEGTSGLFGEEGTETTGSQSTNTFSIKFVAPNTENEISIYGLRWNSLFGGIIESGKVTHSNNKKSVIACLYVPSQGSANYCLNSVPNVQLGSSETECTGVWQNLDCPGQSNWRATGSSNGKYVETDILGVTEGNSCSFGAINTIYIYAKPNDGLTTLDLQKHSKVLGVSPCL